MKFLFMLFFSFITFDVEAKKISNKECVEVASDINQDSAGMMIDEVTSLINTVCIFGDFIYNYRITEDITQKDFEYRIKSELKPSAIQNFCTDPSTRFFLDAVKSVTFKYIRSDGTYLAEYSFTDRDC
ncbi:MAG: hypothetical protein CL691_03975 [Cellvibrionales bacterium]|nr:hypothetical protein [Cellvibrionales bacterium]|tara:strand:- start:41258 stop:41641 length:384 start_codon:yes stop_codon:yes gene_type:complete